MPKEIKIRDLSEEDNELLDVIRKVTRKGQNSKAIMKACQMLLDARGEINVLESQVTRLGDKIEWFEFHLKQYFSIGQTLKESVFGEDNAKNADENEEDL